MGSEMCIRDSYGIICPMVSNRKETENFVQACMYPPHGYRSFGPVRGFLYGGSDYPKYANDEILKFAMIETKESLENLDEIMTTPGLSGIYIGPADLSIAIGEEPGFDKPEGTKAYSEISRILELSLIHISEPTRRTPISYAVFCLKKNLILNINKF